MTALRADEDAPYVAKYEVKLPEIEPQVALPFSPDKVVPVSQVQGMALDGLFIGACTTTEEELVLGALVLETEEKRSGKKGRKPPHPKQLVVPGDLSIQENLRRAGLWEIYQRNGFRIGPPGCSMCLGVASEKAGKGEKWLSSQNRNYENRMGEGSLAHLASAATVAASALQMKVADPRPLLALVDQDRYRAILGERKQRSVPEVRIAEPEMHVAAAASPGGARQARAADRARAAVVRARIQRFGDDVDTDAIIPGEFCHLTTVQELGAKCFHYVRPEFVQRAREGATVVVAGKGWGSGSSREQAVLALKGAGIQAIVAQSYAFIHKRNLVNEALPFLVVSDPQFYEVAGEGAEIEVDLAGGKVVVGGRAFAAAEPSRIIQALADAGGIVPAIQRHGTEVFDKLTA
jgi:aconitate hydratase/homoaconitate hydratase